MISQLEDLTLTKGHGAGNDFILVPDPTGALDISPEVVARICDRHTGIGGDGLIRVIRTAALLGEDPSLTGVLGEASLPEWFMDYRNADGSIAEMCGNGVRVFVHYLRCQGLIDLEPGGSVAVATRGGIKNVTFDAPDYTVDMGEYQLPFGSGGADTRVRIPGVGERVALSVAMPNPHTVVLLENHDELAAANFHATPSYDPVPEFGTNLELAVDRPGAGAPGGADLTERVEMRVLERGVGETLACGTGTCAVALAVLFGRGESEGTVPIHSPGGNLSVRIEAGRAYLTGPAELVADLTLR
ncbi:MAG: diaminopimelate epimerase [Ancrocorticia sp.]